MTIVPYEVEGITKNKKMKRAQRPYGDTGNQRKGNNYLYQINKLNNSRAKMTAYEASTVKSSTLEAKT